MKKTFTRLFIITIFLVVNHSFVNAQYCTPSGGFSACAFGLNDFWITDVSYTGAGSTFSYTGGACVSTSPYYLNTNYTGDVVEGNTYTLSVSREGNTYDTYFNVWVDWNNNNTLNDATPFVENIAANMFLVAGGGLTSTASITIPAGISAGIHRMRVRVQYNVTNANNPCLTTGQAESKDFNVNVIPNCTPPVVIANANSTSICEGLAVVFTGSGALTYTWDSGVTDGIPFQPVATNTYHVTGTDANGCTATDSVTVAVIDTPVFTTTILPDSICAGDSALGVASGSPSPNYNWIPGGITGDSVFLSPTSTTTYTCISISNGCIGRSYASVVVLTPPAVSISQSGSVLTASPSGAISYQWYFEGTEINGATNSTYDATWLSGNYTIVVTDANGCHAESSAFNYTGNGILSLNNSGITVYPNPFSEYFLLRNIFAGVKIELLSMQGQVIEQKISTGENEFVITRDLAPGVYVLRITSDRQIMNLMMVKQ